MVGGLRITILPSDRAALRKAAVTSREVTAEDGSEALQDRRYLSIPASKSVVGVLPWYVSWV